MMVINSMPWISFLMLIVCVGESRSEIACPIKIDKTQSEALEKAGWRLETPLDVGPLQSALLFNLDKSHEFQLAPDKTRKLSDGTVVHQWHAADYMDIELRLRCDYGNGGKMSIHIPAAMKSCEQRMSAWDKATRLPKRVTLRCW